MNNIQSKSDQILYELSRGTQPMPAARIATAISHDLHRTRALIQFMVRSDKIAPQGRGDSGEQTYGLTSRGRELVGKLEGIGQYVHCAAPAPHVDLPVFESRPRNTPARPAEPRLEAQALASRAKAAPAHTSAPTAEPSSAPAASIEHQMLEYFNSQTEATSQDSKTPRASSPAAPDPCLDTASPSPVGVYQTASLQPSRHALTPPELRARFGVLNSGELVIIDPSGRMIMLQPDQLSDLSTTLGARS